MHLFVLSDMPLLRADGRHPWPMVYRTKAERDAVISAVPDAAPGHRYIPVYNSFTMAGYLDIGIPTYDDLAAAKAANHNQQQQQLPWAQRRPVALFRGSSTGCGTSSSTNPRVALAALSASGTVQGLDAGLTAFGKGARFDPETGLGWIRLDENIRRAPAPFVPPREAQQYKYNVHVEGNVAAFRLAGMMRSGCLQIIVDGPYRLWYERLLRVGRPLRSRSRSRPTSSSSRSSANGTRQWHAIGVRRDLSDLDATLRWCREHDAECEAIARRGAELAWSLADWRKLVEVTREAVKGNNAGGRNLGGATEGRYKAK